MLLCLRQTTGIWVGRGGQQPHLPRGPLPHAEQLFPEDDLNSSSGGLNIQIVFSHYLPDLKSASLRHPGCSQGFVRPAREFLMEGWAGARRRAAKLALWEVDCSLRVSCLPPHPRPPPRPAFCEGARSCSSSATKRNQRNWG